MGLQVRIVRDKFRLLSSGYLQQRWHEVVSGATTTTTVSQRPKLEPSGEETPSADRLAI